MKTTARKVKLSSSSEQLLFRQFSCWISLQKYLDKTVCIYSSGRLGKMILFWAHFWCVGRFLHVIVGLEMCDLLMWFFTWQEVIKLPIWFSFIKLFDELNENVFIILFTCLCWFMLCVDYFLLPSADLHWFSVKEVNLLYSEIVVEIRLHICKFCKSPWNENPQENKL